MSELKPCPFCGGEAKYVKDFDHNVIGVECQTKDCFAYLKQYSESRAAWNTRSTPDLSAVREKLEAIRGLLVSDTWTRLHESMPDEDISNEQTAEYLDSQRDGLESKVYKLATAALALLEKGGSNAS